MDVVGLVSNIPHSDRAYACREQLAQRPVCVPANEDVLKLIHFMLDKNCFIFKGKHYRQTLGTRMAPSFANLFMAVRKKKKKRSWQQHRIPRLRSFSFGSSTIFLWSGCMGKKAFCAFLTMQIEPMHPSIQFTMHYLRWVHYLDAALAIEDDGRILSDLYTKPADGHQYDMAFLGVCLELSFNICYHPAITLPTFTNTSLVALWIRQIVSSDEQYARSTTFQLEGTGNPNFRPEKKNAQYTTTRWVREKKWTTHLESSKTHKCMSQDWGIDFLNL